MIEPLRKPYSQCNAEEVEILQHTELTEQLHDVGDQSVAGNVHAISHRSQSVQENKTALPVFLLGTVGDVTSVEGDCLTSWFNQQLSTSKASLLPAADG